MEDQPELLRALRINLRARQYDVLTARTGREGLAVAAGQPPDAVILDLGLPDIDGTEVIVELRRWSRAPIIVLSGRTSPGDKIGALDVGADDYVTKPFAMAELLARLRAALRRDEGDLVRGRPLQATLGQWLVDLAAYQVTRASAARGRWRGRPRRRPRGGGEEGAGGPETRSASRRPNGGSWKSCCGVPASSSDRRRSWSASGARDSSSAPTTCDFTWPACGASWKTTRRAPAICSPNPAWAIVTSRKVLARRRYLPGPTTSRETLAQPSGATRCHAVHTHRWH